MKKGFTWLQGVPPAFLANEVRMTAGGSGKRRSRWTRKSLSGVWASFAKGTDGVMAPTVTQEEKDKRRKAHAVRRQQRSAAGMGNAKELAPARPGSDERYKEMKIGVFYDQDKKHRHAFATEAMCKTLTLRLKRPGMKWDRDHAAGMMNLQAMYESGQAATYWAMRRAAP